MKAFYPAVEGLFLHPLGDGEMLDLVVEGPLFRDGR